MTEKIEGPSQWEPQRFDEDFVETMVSNLMEFVRFKKISEKTVLKKMGYKIPCEHPAEAVQQRKVAEISDPQFVHKQWQYYCTRCDQVVFPIQFRTLP